MFHLCFTQPKDKGDSFNPFGGIVSRRFKDSACTWTSSLLSSGSLNVMCSLINFLRPLESFHDQHTAKNKIKWATDRPCQIKYTLLNFWASSLLLLHYRVAVESVRPPPRIGEWWEKVSSSRYYSTKIILRAPVTEQTNGRQQQPLHFVHRHDVFDWPKWRLYIKSTIYGIDFTRSPSTRTNTYDTQHCGYPVQVFLKFNSRPIQRREDVGNVILEFPKSAWQR